MGRRKILIPLAAVIAALGTLMVFMYAQGAETRASDKFDGVQVLQATKQVDSGEAFDDAARAGKFKMTTVARNQVLEGSQTDLTSLSGQIATQTIYAGEQVISAKWGAEAEAETSLAIPKDMMAISVNLTDPSRVAGFVTPGSDVALFLTGTRIADSKPYAQLLLERVKVLGIGATSTITSTTTSDEGAQTTEQVPQTLMTLAVSESDAKRIFYAVSNGTISVGLLTKDTTPQKAPAVTEQNLFE